MATSSKSNPCPEINQTYAKATMDHISQEKVDLVSVSFSHVHLYVNAVHDIQDYKALEGYLNEFSQFVKREHDGVFPSTIDVKHYRKIWRSILREHSEPRDETVEEDDNDMTFVSQNRDVIRQLIAGFGFRITGIRIRDKNNCASRINTRSVLLSSSDPDGVQIIVTALDPSSQGSDSEKCDEHRYFDACT